MVGAGAMTHLGTWGPGDLSYVVFPDLGQSKYAMVQTWKKVMTIPQKKGNTNIMGLYNDV